MLQERLEFNEAFDPRSTLPGGSHEVVEIKPGNDAAEAPTVRGFVGFADAADRGQTLGVKAMFNVVSLS